LVWVSPLKKINEIFMWSEPPSTKYAFLFNILSLGGLPPFVGFLAKLSIIIYLTQTNLYFLALLLVIISLVSLFYYFRLTYSFAISKQNIKYNALPSIYKTNNVLLFSATSLNILIPLINSTF
jgi:NADH-ubiquinone oxidoreductase chain 2